MNPQGADLLSQLRDIHAAPPVPWWPPAPGWWVLAVLLLGAALVAVRHAWRVWRKRQRRQALLQWLEAIERETDPRQQPGEYLGRVNALIKWVALRAFPDSGCAGLQGQDWARFVTGRLGNEVDAEVAGALAEGPYRARPEFDPAAVQRLARSWVRRYG